MESSREENVGTAPRPAHPLGPLVSWMVLHGWIGRLYAAGVLAGIIAIGVATACVHPAGRHMGTHQQLGLPACGFVMATGLPCPTCGMTTAFAYTVQGHWIEAMRSQLAGFVFAIVTGIVGIASAVGVVTGRVPMPNWYRINPMTVVWWCSALFVLAWGVKVAQVLAQRP